MKENAAIALFNDVMRKYRLVEPVPAAVQRHIRVNKRKQFNEIFKRTSGYSLLFVLVSTIYFTLKRLGVAISITKSAVILAVLSLLTAGAVTVAVYWAVAGSDSRVILDKAPERAAAPAGRDVGVEKEEKDLVEPAAIIEDRVGIQSFTAISMPASKASEVSDRLANSLSSLRGGERVVNLRYGRGGKKSGMMVFGTVEPAGEGYSVTVRVVNVKDSRILFYDSETAVSAQDVDGACQRLARKIYGVIK
jgi:hypothetical protein